MFMVAEARKRKVCEISHRVGDGLGGDVPNAGQRSGSISGLATIQMLPIPASRGVYEDSSEFRIRF